MTLSIRNPEADRLATRLAALDDATVTEAVIVALREAIAARTRRESAQETAREILKRRGLAFVANPRPCRRRPITIWPARTECDASAIVSIMAGDETAAVYEKELTQLAQNRGCGIEKSMR